MKRGCRELVPPGGTVSRRRRTGKIPHGARLGAVTAMGITPKARVTPAEASSASGWRSRRPGGARGRRWTANGVDGSVSQASVVNGADQGGGVGQVDRRGFLRHLIEVLDVSHNLTNDVRQEVDEDEAEEDPLKLLGSRLQGAHVLQHGSGRPVAERGAVVEPLASFQGPQLVVGQQEPLGLLEDISSGSAD